MVWYQLLGITLALLNQTRVAVSPLDIPDTRMLHIHSAGVVVIKSTIEGLRSPRAH